jgi:hypothetical protein
MTAPNFTARVDLDPDALNSAVEELRTPTRKKPASFAATHVLIDHTPGEEAIHIDGHRVPGNLISADYTITTHDLTRTSVVTIQVHAHNVRVLRTLDEDLALIRLVAEREKRAAMSWLERFIDDTTATLGLAAPTYDTPERA